jgi:Pretoxin HINT domain
LWRAEGSEEVITNDEPPFYAEGKRLTPAAKLTLGDVVRLAGDRLSVVGNLKRNFNGQLAYNLSVANDHTYFVGQSRAWVHNGCVVPISVEDALTEASKFLDLGTPIRSVDGKTGVQFIQEAVDASGQTITKRVGFDLNPASPHVQQYGPHLNLQTQINGVIQRNGPLADPHLPVDPSTIRPGDY